MVGRVRKLGRRVANQGVGEVREESHLPVGVVASLWRFRTSVSEGVSYGFGSEVLESDVACSIWRLMHEHNGK